MLLPADPGEAEALLGQGQLGSRASAEWALLRSLVRRHGELRTAEGLLVHGGCLHVAVADAIFKVDRRLGLPVWLLQMFKVGKRTGGDREPLGTGEQRRGLGCNIRNMSSQQICYRKARAFECIVL